MPLHNEARVILASLPALFAIVAALSIRQVVCTQLFLPEILFDPGTLEVEGQNAPATSADPSEKENAMKAQGIPEERFLIINEQMQQWPSGSIENGFIRRVVRGRCGWTWRTIGERRTWRWQLYGGKVSSESTFHVDEQQHHRIVDLRLPYYKRHRQIDLLLSRYTSHPLPRKMLHGASQGEKVDVYTAGVQVHFRLTENVRSILGDHPYIFLHLAMAFLLIGSIAGFLHIIDFPIRIPM